MFGQHFSMVQKHGLSQKPLTKRIDALKCGNIDEC